MIQRNAAEYIEKKGIDYWKDTCLLCSEHTPEYCHRRLVSLEIISIFPQLDVEHLV
jgi:hypothetical protein